MYSIPTIIIMLAASVAAVLFSRRYKSHLSITVIVLLLFLNVIVNSLCWVMLEVYEGSLTAVKSIMKTMEISGIAENLLLAAIIIAALIILMKKRKAEHK